MDRLEPTERALTEAAAAILAEAGFTTGSERFAEGVDVLIAENPYAVAAIYEAKSWRDVPHFEELQTRFANWAAGRDAGPRMWDLYLVLLVQNVLEDEDFKEAERASSNLERVRKIVRAGISADRDAVKDALASLLPLEVPDRTNLPEPLRELEASLTERGLSLDAARQAIAAFIARREMEGPGDAPTDSDSD